MKTSHFKLLFFGSDIFSVRVLKHLLEKSPCTIKTVAKPHTDLGKYSVTNNISTFDWPLTNSTRKAHDSNLALVASFGSLIDEHTINSFQYGMFNVHPSLLPQYRGSTPIQTAIRDGLEETGCTIMRIPPIPKFDIGEIVLQEKVVIQDREYALSLSHRLAAVGAKLTLDLLDNYDECLLKTRPQGDVGKSYAKKLKKEDGILQFKTESSLVIDRKFRAFLGSIDLTMKCLNGLVVKLDDLRGPAEMEQYAIDSLFSREYQLRTSDKNSESGTLYFHKLRHILCVKCIDLRWVGFGSATPSGKPRMTALEFYNGYLAKLDYLDRKTDC